MKTDKTTRFDKFCYAFGLLTLIYFVARIVYQINFE